ncbi:MAG: TlpA family protein disulfide reductase, partial [Bacteroidia bacterium]|nr:TlpA family protein disulfide reductase [Bacteroidia bacterium]
MKKYFALVFTIITQTLSAQIAPGTWHGELILHDTLALPFNFEVRGQTATIINAEERIDATI